MTKMKVWRQISIICTFISVIWRRISVQLRSNIQYILIAISQYAARRPYTCVIGSILLSSGILTAGLCTNFRVETNEKELWKPMNSRIAREGMWAETFRDIKGGSSVREQGQRRLQTDENAKSTRKTAISFIVYKSDLQDNGPESLNMANEDSVRRLFEVHETVVETEGYASFCAEYGNVQQCPDNRAVDSEISELCEIFGIPTGNDAPLTCQRDSPTMFWLNSYQIFDFEATSAEAVRKSMSVRRFEGAELEFDIRNIMGYAAYDDDDTLIYARSFSGVFQIPKGTGGRDLLIRIEGRLLNLREQWSKDTSNPYNLEIFSTVSFVQEFHRSILKDLPLVPLAFIVMTLFIVVMCYNRDVGSSKCWVGFGAVACVLLSIISGYGLLFCVGVPVTVITQVLPFIMFGIGLDDAFIILQAYDRTSAKDDPVLRLKTTMEQVNMSIFMTTMTSAVAFMLGCSTSIPAVRWLCLYAFPTILIDFFFQITFFIAIVVIDAEWQSSGILAKGCCRFSPKVSIGADVETVDLELASSEDLEESERSFDPENEPESEVEESGKPFDPEDGTEEVQENETYFDPKGDPSTISRSWKGMEIYSNLLLSLPIQVAVLVLFGILLGVCAYSATDLKVDFENTSVLPRDSHLIDFDRALVEYSQVPPLSPSVYFRNFNASDPDMLRQMDDYVHQLVNGLDAASRLPFQYWIGDYQSFLSENNFTETLDGESIRLFLKDDRYRRHRSSIVLDSEGRMIASRTRLELDNLDMNNADQYLSTFQRLHEIGRRQPANAGKEDWSFFVFSPAFYLWAFLDATKLELLHSTVYGILAVTVMSAIFLPHWSACFIIIPMIIVLYIDLLGLLQVCNIPLNGISYVALVMSLGLMVDFIMHVAHCYLSLPSNMDREAKTKKILQTMGTSILLGGFSTFLGTLPLAFASNTIFHTFFVTFLGIVALGASHGLILLPVLLSMLGP